MNESLRTLIVTYQEKVRELVPMLASQLNIELPITNNEWVALEIQGREQTPNGLKYFKHGFGVAIKFGTEEIDIDFGENGEIDGFDAWRLFGFAQANGIQTPYKGHREIEVDIKNAVAEGDIVYSGYILYYLRNER